jgi:hypothetical protein
MNVDASPRQFLHRVAGPIECHYSWARAMRDLPSRRLLASGPEWFNVKDQLATIDILALSIRNGVEDGIVHMAPDELTCVHSVLRIVGPERFRGTEADMVTKALHHQMVDEPNVVEVQDHDVSRWRLR